MGLLGDSFDDPKTMGVMQLAAGLLSGGNFGQALGRGLQGYQQSMSSAEEAAQRKEMMDWKRQEMRAAQEAAQRRQQFLDTLGRQFGGVTSQQALAAPSAGSPAQAGSGSLMAWPPQPATAKPGQVGPTVERAALIGQRAPVDWQQVMTDGMAAGFTPDQIKALAEAQNLGRQKVARVEETVDAQGRPIKRQFSEFGDVIGNDMGSYKEGKIVNFGQFQYLVDPVSGKRTLLGQNTMSPGEAASNAVARGQLALSGERLRFDKSQAGKPQFHDGAWAVPPRDMRPGETRSAMPQPGAKDATEALALIKQARDIIPKSTGSYLGVAADHVARAAGFSTDGDEAAAQLKAIEGALVSKMPKMSGPQSDKDVLLYRQMAGEIGDPTIPHGRRLAALKEVEKIQQRYAGIQPDQPQQPKPASRIVKLDGGGSASAVLGPDGNYYVERGGKRYRVED